MLNITWVRIHYTSPLCQGGFFWTHVVSRSRGTPIHVRFTFLKQHATVGFSPFLYSLRALWRTGLEFPLRTGCWTAGERALVEWSSTAQREALYECSSTRTAAVSHFRCCKTQPVKVCPSEEGNVPRSVDYRPETSAPRLGENKKHWCIQTDRFRRHSLTIRWYLPGVCVQSVVNTRLLFQHWEENSLKHLISCILVKF